MRGHSQQPCFTTSKYNDRKHVEGSIHQKHEKKHANERREVGSFKSNLASRRSVHASTHQSEKHDEEKKEAGKNDISRVHLQKT